MMKRISLDPTMTCLHAGNEMLGIPSGLVPDRTGGGPPSSKRAAVKVSQGGPPPCAANLSRSNALQPPRER